MKPQHQSQPVQVIDRKQVFSDLVVLTDRDDGVHVRAHGAEIVSCAVKDLRSAERRGKAHCDAFQGIAPGKNRDWYALGLLCDWLVMNCEVDAADSQLQGISGFDGLFSGIRVLNNRIKTASRHKVTFNGLLNGEISGNVDGAGEPVPVQLYPGRIAGGLEGAPVVWVIGFQSGEGQPVYQPIKSDGVQPIRDQRQAVFNDVDIFLDQFDWLGFRAAVQAVYHADIAQHCRAVVKLALGFGTVVSRQEQDDWKAVEVPPARVVMSHKTTNKNTTVFDPFVELGLVQGHEIPRGIRNNNPGNIEYVEDNQWLGLDHPPSDGRYCRFTNPKLAIRALVLLLLNYQRRHRLKTVAAIIGRYAPRQDGNATKSYIKYVCDQIGVGPKTPISVRDFRTAQHLVKAIIYFENGMNPYPDEMIVEGIGLAGIATTRESVAAEVKPRIQSTEQIAVATTAAGTGGLAALEWLKDQIVANQTRVIEGLTKLDENLEGVAFLGWVQVVILLGIFGSIWYLAWRRGEASFLGIR